MKKMFVCCATLCLALSLFRVSALAGDLEINVSPVDANAVQVEQKAGSANPIFTVTQKTDAQSGQLYLVMIQQVEQGTDASAKPLPTKENLYYLNVEEVTGASFSTEAYPRDLEEGTYIVYLSDYSGSDAGAAKGVATITVSASGGGGSSGGQSYTLGDVNGKDGITAVDALLAAQIAAKTLSNVEDWQKMAADVNKKDGVTAADAVLILQKAAFPNLDFSQYQN